MLGQVRLVGLGTVGDTSGEKSKVRFFLLDFSTAGMTGVESGMIEIELITDGAAGVCWGTCKEEGVLVGAGFGLGTCKEEGGWVAAGGGRG